MKTSYTISLLVAALMLLSLNVGITSACYEPPDTDPTGPDGDLNAPEGDPNDFKDGKSQGKVADPVTLKTGEYTLSAQDVFIRGRAMNIAVKRHYRNKPIKGGRQYFTGGYCHDPICEFQLVEMRWCFPPEAFDVIGDCSFYASGLFPRGGAYQMTLKKFCYYGEYIGDTPVSVDINYSPYNSRFGWGWDMSFNLKVKETGIDVEGNTKTGLIFFDGKNNRIFYEYDESNDIYVPSWSWDEEAGPHDYITSGYGYPYVLKKKNGALYLFNGHGNIAEIRDRCGNSITFTYYEAGPYDGNELKLHKITDDRGKEVLTLSYNDGLLETITDFTNRTWTYTYDEDDNLTDVLSPDNSKTTYTYDGNHNLLTVTDPENDTYVDNNYDASGRVETQEYGSGTYELSYYGSSGSIVYVTDPEEFITHNYINGRGNIWRTRRYTGNLRPDEPDYYETTYGYNSHSQCTRVTLPNGDQLRYTYDDSGNLITSTYDPQSPGSYLVTSFEYESNFNLVNKITDPRENIINFTRDPANGNLTKITYPEVMTDEGLENPEIDFTYNTYGQIETITSPDDIVIKYEYYDTGFENDPSYGRLRKAIMDYGAYPSLNIIVEYEYDDLGRPIEITDPENNVTKYTYDTLGQLTQIEAPAPFNHLTKFSYNKNKKLTKVEREYGGTWQTFRYFYDILDKVIYTTNPLSDMTQMVYDKNRRLTCVRDMEGNDTTREYDGIGLPWKLTDAKNGITEYKYTENNQTKEIKDAKGQITSYDYDAYGRLETITYEDDTTEEFEYDETSNLTHYTNRKGETIDYGHDALNRVISKKRGTEATIDLLYDIAGRLVEVDNDTDTSGFIYDRIGRLEEVIDTESRSISYEYNNLSRRTELTYPDDSYITYEYDELSRLTDIKGDGGETLAHYDYDELSRRTGLELGNNTDLVYDYNLGNRLTSLTNNLNDAGGTTLTFDYTHDKVGNRLTMAKNGVTGSYIYDDLYQLYHGEYCTSLDNGLVAHWKLDDGTGTTAEDSAGNNDGTVNGATWTDGKIYGALSFDGSDDYVQITEDNLPSSGPVTVSLWVNAYHDRDTCWLHYNVGDIHFTIGSTDNGTGRLVIKDSGNNNYCNYLGGVNCNNQWVHIAAVFDSDGLIEKVYRKGVECPNRYSYPNTGYYYPGWSISGTSTRLGRQGDSGNYYNGIMDDVRVYGRALNEDEISALAVSGYEKFYHDALGNRSEVEDENGTAFYIPNELNQYVSAGGTYFSYDDNGNLTSDGTNSYTYDCENRLTSATTPDYTVTGVYDFFGRRIEKMVDDGSTITTTKYTYDGFSVIAEYDGSDTLLRKFVYGPGIDKPVAMIVVDGQTETWYYYHYDSLGSVMALSDSDRNIVESYNYSAFGKTKIFGENHVEISASAIGNPFMFTGRRFEEKTGLYYYRLRYYDPDIGRFLQPDPVGYAGGMNLYAYCGNNPTNLTDPLGLLAGAVAPARGTGSHSGHGGNVSYSDGTSVYPMPPIPTPSTGPSLTWSALVVPNLPDGGGPSGNNGKECPKIDWNQVFEGVATFFGSLGDTASSGAVIAASGGATAQLGASVVFVNGIYGMGIGAAQVAQGFSGQNDYMPTSIPGAWALGFGNSYARGMDRGYGLVSGGGSPGSITGSIGDIIVDSIFYPVEWFAYEIINTEPYFPYNYR